MWEFFKSLEEFIIYIYPGVISLWMYQFIQGRKARVDRSNFLLIVSMGYFYVSLYCYIFDTNTQNLDYLDKIIIGIMAITTPAISNYIKRAWKDEIDKLLPELNINTKMDGTVFNYAYKRSKEEIKRKKTKADVVLYTKDFRFRYTGELCCYEGDAESGREFCLKKYKIEERNAFCGDKLIVERGNDGSRIYIDAKDIECVEI